ncbi:MAG TPA: ATP-binding cassette domain-containing protein [Polyangiaceae bacterium]|nr:ATP-binding cassette domain-containing protein [Polyangiaceae bacterium]
MSELRLQALSHAELSHVSASFSAGTHVVLGSERDGTGTLIQLAAGMLEPATGSVRLDGVAAWSNARLRRRIASLYADETLLPARDVTGAVRLALQARGDARSAPSVLDSAGLARFAAQRVSELTTREARAISLSIALSHREPALLALHDPLNLLGIVQEDFIVQSLERFGAAGAIVLCTASRLEDAARLAGTAHALERGVWLDSAHARPPLGTVTLRVHTPEPRRLAARLSEAPDISGVEWSGGAELLVHGSELERLAHSVVANARAEAIRITALKQHAPPLEALAATRAGLAQAYYERARGAGPSARQS